MSLLWLTALLLLLPATEAAMGIVNRLVAALFAPRVLPKLDFSEGIPADCSTLVVVPTLALNEKQVEDMVEQLEIRYLANRQANLSFGLVTDTPDAPSSSTRKIISRNFASRESRRSTSVTAPTARAVSTCSIARANTTLPSRSGWAGSASAAS